MIQKGILKEGARVIYPCQGVGVVSCIKKQEIAGHTLEVVVLSFEKSKMNVTIPLSKVLGSGVRFLATAQDIGEVLSILSSESPQSIQPWIKRQMTYELKIRTGDLKKIAEVLRDLCADIKRFDRSYVKTLLFKKAKDLLAQEIKLVLGCSREEADQKIQSHIGLEV